ncbi:hypothetical protein BDN70DRAFT_870662 [Pholiota conissans]|uniref:Uncharacterized protein n=1 Tax=Pholiota conissans TaxID=109636 RepID=A0A9P6D6P1_9AGAR|nr:hypothetical protein BDN70DRAFT_870662 [Pholiota conissans]
MEATAKTSQPQAATQMKVMSVPEGNTQTQQQIHEQHQHQHKASRIRGGGAGKVRFLAFVSITSLQMLSFYVIDNGAS